MSHSINEKLCVNDNVIQMGKEIMDEVEKRLKTTKSYISKELNRIIQKGSFVYNTNGKLPIESLTINYIIHPYDNINDFKEDYKIGYISINCESDFEEQSIYLSLATINGELVQESIGNIEHELNHILQCSFGQKQNETLYEKIIYQIENSFGLYQDVAYALYLSFKTEIASFSVQYYTYLKANNVPLQGLNRTLQDDVNSPYSVFIQKYNKVMSNARVISDDKVRQLFGITKNEVFKRLENAKKRYKTKMLKVNLKYRDEVNENYEREKIKNRGKNHFIEIHQFASFRRHNFLLECYHKGIHEEASEYE